MSNPECTSTLPRKASAMKRLIQAALLAIVVIPLGSVALEADTMYFNCSPYSYDGCTEGEGTSATSYFGEFGEYYLFLQFALAGGANFQVEVTTEAIDEETFQSNATQFPGYECLAVTQQGECVEFTVDPSEDMLGNWSHYTIEIGWQKIDGQVLEEARMTLLHDRSDTPPPPGASPDSYDFDVCATAIYDECDIDPDPRIRSGDTDFRAFIPAYRPATAVPEPSSLLLLSAGIGGALFRRRRRG